MSKPKKLTKKQLRKIRERRRTHGDVFAATTSLVGSTQLAAVGLTDGVIDVVVSPSPDDRGKALTSFRLPPELNELVKDLVEDERNNIFLNAMDRVKADNAFISVEYQKASEISFDPSDTREVFKTARFPSKYMREALIASRSPALAAVLSMLSEPKPVPKQTPARTLDNYLFTLDRLRWHTSVETDRLRQEQAAVLWAEVSRARLIEIRPELYTAIYHESDVYTTEHICGYKWERFEKDVVDAGHDPNNSLLKKESSEMIKIISEVGRNVHFPEKLPFPSVFLSFRSEISLNHDQTMVRVPHRFRANIPGAATGRLIGYLLTEGPMAVEFYVVDNVKPNESLFLYEVLYIHQNFPGVDAEECNHWVQPWQLHPWILNVLVSLINDHKTLIIEHPDSLFRKQWKKNRKLFSVKRRIPPPYYSVILRDKIVKDMLETTRKRHPAGMTFQYGHRFDVRRHERVKIMRGPLPLSDRLRKRLQKEPGRRIYTIEDLRADDAERLARRGIQPKRRDEWMAILVSEVHPHQKPKDESLPYIPATRKLPKNRTILT